MLKLITPESCVMISPAAKNLMPLIITSPLLFFRKILFFLFIHIHIYYNIHKAYWSSAKIFDLRGYNSEIFFNISSLNRVFVY